MSEKMGVIKKAFPIVWYNIGWFGAIYAGKWGHADLSLIFPLILFFFMLKTASWNISLMGKLLILALIGMGFDSWMSSLRWVIYYPEDFIFLPLWMISIWFLFVMILPILEGLFRGRWILAGILGGIFGPLSYVSGEPLGVLDFASTSAVMAYVVFWTFYFSAALIFVGKSRPAA